MSPLLVATENEQKAR